MQLTKESIDLIRKLNEQFNEWEADAPDGETTGNVADVGMGPDATGQHDAAVRLFAAIPKIGDFLAQMVRFDALPFTLTRVPLAPKWQHSSSFLNIAGPVYLY